MGFTVDVQTFGLVISDNERQKQIFLGTKAWECLVECKNQIDQALKEKKESQWTIDDSRDLKVTNNAFQGKWYLHIRHWWKNRPTKMGVSLLEKDWEELKSHMTENAETTLGISVMKQMLKNRLRKAIRSQCDGCQNDWPSQSDHDCLMEPQTTAELALDTVVKDFPVTDFILQLAQAAVKENLILETPHQTLKRLMQFHREGIQRELLDDYDY